MERRIKLVDVNQYLMCTLCSGYIIDATTIIECLHSFCKTCIHQYLEENKFCPVCDVQVHKTKPHLNVRPDKTFQALIYKIVPGLYKDEMERRRQFYAKNPQSDVDPLTLNMPDQPVPDYPSVSILCPNETLPDWISLCLELSHRLPLFAKVIPNGQACVQTNGDPVRDQRHLLCPAGLTIGHLKKFLRGKFDLFANLHIDVYHSDEILKDVYSLSDIASIYTWRRVEPLKLYYVVYEMIDSTAVSYDFAAKVDNDKVIRDASCTSSSCAEVNSDTLLNSEAKSVNTKQRKTAEKTVGVANGNKTCSDQTTEYKSCAELVSRDLPDPTLSSEVNPANDRTVVNSLSMEISCAKSVSDFVVPESVNSLSVSAPQVLLNSVGGVLPTLGHEKQGPGRSENKTPDPVQQSAKVTAITDSRPTTVDMEMEISTEVVPNAGNQPSIVPGDGESVTTPREKCGFESQLLTSDVETVDQTKKENRPAKKRSSEIEQLFLDSTATREVRNLYRELAMSSDKHGRFSHLRLRLRTGSVIRRRSIGLNTSRNGKARVPIASSRSKTYVMRRRLAESNKKK